MPVRAVWITAVSWTTGCAEALARSATLSPCGNTLARPQSITWTSPKLPTMMFEGFQVAMDDTPRRGRRPSSEQTCSKIAQRTRS